MPEICKHNKIYRQCLACAMEEVEIRRQIREWQKEFDLAKLSGIESKKRIIQKKES